jgi:uncharacterized protein YjbI with pentapeptide repeats
VKYQLYTRNKAALKEPFEYRLDLMGKRIYNVNLAGIDLHDADICLSHIIDSNLSYANLCGTNLGNTYLEWSNLRGANLANAYLSQTKLHHADLTEAKLLQSYLLKVELNSAKLSRAILHNLVIVNCQSYGGLECADADFEGAILDQETLFHYLKKSGAKHVPHAVTSEEELISELKKKDIEDKLFHKILERSVFHKPEQSPENY